MRTLSLISALFICTASLFSINDNVAADAVSLGTGGASVILPNVYGAFNNQALLSLVEQPTIACSFSSLYTLNDSRVMAAVPFSFGTIGVSLSRFGSSLYSEFKAGVSYSRFFGKSFSASMQFDMLSVHPSPNQESLYAFTGEIGIWVQLVEDFTLGFHLYNFVNAEYATLYYDEAVPINMKLGLGYTVLTSFLLTAEFENSSLYGSTVRGGVSYDIRNILTVRAGGASHPALASIGLGVKLAGLQFDVAAQSVRYVGKTGAVSISYAF